MQTNFKTAYSSKVPVTINFGKRSMTKQSHKDECNINKIVNKYMRTGQIDNLMKNPPNYMYCTSETFQESLNIIDTAQKMFDDMPSQIRNKFENDPAKFLDFVQNPENLNEMRSLGLAYPDFEEVQTTSLLDVSSPTDTKAVETNEVPLPTGEK